MYFSEWMYKQRLREAHINLFRSGAKISQSQWNEIVKVFIPFAEKFLKLKNIPEIHFVDDSNFAKKLGAFGIINGDDIIKIDIKDRHPMDALRTLAHELVHYHQHQRGIHGSGIAGSKTENEANKMAGLMLRKFGDLHSELFTLSPIK